MPRMLCIKVVYF